MLDKPAMTLLHLGPGFANGIANLHNARRAKSPVLNVIGEHATWHLNVDPPLAMDIESLVRTVSGWWRTNKSARDIPGDVAEAVAAARVGQVATLIVPHDNQETEGEGHPIKMPHVSFDPLEPDSIEAAAKRLRTSRKVALLLGGRALRKSGLDAAARIRKMTGCDLFSPAQFGYMERGVGLPFVERIPYFPEKATARLSGYGIILLAGAPEPVTFFGYPGIKSQILADEQERITLCTDRQDVVQALENLADALSGTSTFGADDAVLTKMNRPPLPDGELTGQKACLTLAALQPENAILIDEAITARFMDFPFVGELPPHSLLSIAGGSIGFGIPCATGAAIACPDRLVIDLQADGSALYTIQGLWTQAREGLNVITLICSNRSYRILQMELTRAGIPSLGPNARALTELTNPAIDWVKAARGFGVPGVTVSTVKDLARELSGALAGSGPRLIEMLLP
jgi:acetolactate synthase-1/2/3 large subunit